jgi:hypothetical protein
MSQTGLIVCLAADVAGDSPSSAKTITSPSVTLVVSAPSR